MTSEGILSPEALLDFDEIEALPSSLPVPVWTGYAATSDATFCTYVVIGEDAEAYSGVLTFAQSPLGLDAYSISASYTHYWAVDTPSGIQMFHYSASSWNRGGISSYLKPLTLDRAEVTVGGTYGFMREYYPSLPPTDDAFRQMVTQQGSTYKTTECEDKAIAEQFESHNRQQSELWYNALFRNCATEGNRIFQQNMSPDTYMHPQGHLWDVLQGTGQDYTGGQGGGL